MIKSIGIILAILFLSIATFVYYKKQSLSPTLSTIPPIEIATTPMQNAPALSVVATGLEVPWALAFLPTGELLVTERVGRVRLIDTKGILQTQPILTLDRVKQIGEGGLHGIAIHPDFTDNHFVYLYYTYGSNGKQTLNRVSRFVLENNALTQEQIIVDAIPGALFHNGGRIKFGPDKYLYITTGDAQEPSLAQDKNSLAGKILRVTDDGKPAMGNPFDTRVYSYGHRNPQGITWDTDNVLWETEHGQSATDELNKIEMGNNYGWPTVYGDATQQGVISPMLQSGAVTWAPAGLAYLDGSLFFGGLRGRALYQVQFKGGKSVSIQEHFPGELGRIREVIVGPDAALYITTSNRDGRGNPTSDDDRILRVNPEKL